MEELIAKLSPDLQGLLDARKVPRQTQADLAKHGVDCIPMLSAVGPAGHRHCCRSGSNYSVCPTLPFVASRYKEE